MNRSSVLWIRVSSEQQASGFSLKSQEDLLKKAAEGFDILATFIVAESAKVSENRHKFKEMVEYVKVNKIGHIFAWSQDRLGRHYKDFNIIQSLIDDNDVSVVLVESKKTISRQSTIADRFLFQVMAALAESDNRKRAADTQRGMRRAAEEGRVPHLVPIAYINMPDPSDTIGKRRTVIQDDERAPLVAWAFEAFSKGGQSLSTLAVELNNRGLTTKPSPRRSPGPITVGNLHKILTNRFYCGEFPSGGTIYTGTYKPLVTKELWDKVQARLNENRTYSRPATRKFFAFRPFLRCGYCHCSLTANDTPGRHKKGKFTYYFCTSGKLRVDPNWYKKKFGTDKCLQKYWKEEEIDNLIEGEIGKLYLDDTVVAKIKEQLKTTNVREEVYERKELRRIEAERTRKQNHIRISYRDRLDGKISLEQFEEVQAGAQADLHRIESNIEKLSQRNFKYREQGSRVLELLNGMKAVYKRADLPGKHKILEVMLDRIVLRDGKAHVVWNFPFDMLQDLGEMFINKGMWGE
jgi:DNA invertase Pin-like site-specific DNA recombinase